MRCLQGFSPLTPLNVPSLALHVLVRADIPADDQSQAPLIGITENRELWIEQAVRQSQVHGLGLGISIMADLLATPQLPVIPAQTVGSLCSYFCARS